MRKPDVIMMWKLSDKMADILSTEYLLGGSVGASLWSLGNGEFNNEHASLTPGSMVLLFKDHDGQCQVVGGGYFLGWTNFTVQESWDLYGVRNGAYDFDDFVHDVESRGGNRDSILTSARLVHTFVFNNNDNVTIPEALKEGFTDQQHFTLPLDEPLGCFLKKRILDVRDDYIGSDGHDWQGMYYMASHRNSKSYAAEFHARVLDAYHFQCALTGIRARPALSIAHIQPFYDAQFQSASNGIVLRSDIYQLFKDGYITLIYSDDGKKLIAKVSQTLRTAGGDDYMSLDGKELHLPDDPAFWPDKKYVLWHNRNCFESWLRVGGSHV